MWFKNLSVFKIENLEGDFSELNARFSEDEFCECGPTDEKKAGWIAPMGENYSEFIHTARGSHLFALKTEVKKIPAAFINDQLRKQEDEMKEQNSEFKKFSKEEREERKEKIKIKHLPNAFPQSSVMFAYVDTIQNLLIVDTSSASKAEGLVLFLRGMMENSNVNFIPLQTTHEASNIMGTWLMSNEPYSGLMFGSKCLLKDLSSTGSIKYAKHDMDDNQLVDYLKEDKKVAELEFQWEENLSFVLTDDFVFKSVKFLDLYKSQIGDISSDEYEAMFDAEFDTMTRAVQEFIPYIVECFGGVVDA